MPDSNFAPLPKNIVILVLDALRYDAVGYEPDKRYWEAHGLSDLIKTPNIDALAGESSRFHQTISPAPYTTAAHASLFTGLYPHRHGVRSFFNSTIHKDAFTIAEVLKEREYITSFSVDYRAAFVFNGLDRGVDRMCWSKKHSVRESIFDFFSENKNKRHFIFIHTADTHQPYSHSFDPFDEDYNQECKDWLLGLYRKYGLEPKNYSANPIEKLVLWHNDIKKELQDRGKFVDEMLPQYLRGVEKTDGSKIKHVLDFFLNSNDAEDTLLVVTSDHGDAEYLMGTGNLTFDHGEFLPEGLIRVPLLIHYPQLGNRSVHIHRQISLTDIFPTILELTGGNPKKIDYSLDGKSLVSDLTGRSTSDRICYSEVWKYNWDDVEHQINKALKNSAKFEENAYTTILFERSVRTPEHKYIERGDVMPNNYHKMNAKKLITTAYNHICAQLNPPSQKLMKQNLILLYFTFLFEIMLTILRMLLPKTLKKRISIDGNSHLSMKAILASTKKKFIQKFFNDKKRKRLFFNIKNDPFEKKDLMRNGSTVDVHLNFLRQEFFSITQKPPIDSQQIEFKSVDEKKETIDALKSLGYF